MRRLLLAMLLAPGLAVPQTSPSPSRPWTPPAGALPPVAPPKAPALPQEWLSKGALLTLPQLLDVALAQNPLCGRLAGPYAYVPGFRIAAV